MSKRRVRARMRSSTATRPGAPGRSRADGRALERREDVCATQLEPGRSERFELVERARDGVVGLQVEPRAVVERRSRRAVGVPQHRGRELPGRRDHCAVGERELERRQRAPVAQLHRHRDRAVAPHDASPAQAALDPVDVPARDAGVRRAQVRVQLRSLAAQPGEAEQGEQRVPERGRPQSDATLERERDAERAERRLEREPDALDRRADDRDLLRGDAGAHEAEDLVRDELERSSPTRALEEPQGRVERAPSRGLGEQLALDVRERRWEELVGARRQLDDVPVRKERQIVDRPPQRGVRRTAGLVGQRDVHVRPRGERLEESPLGTGEVLEAVGEDRRAAPGSRGRRSAARSLGVEARRDPRRLGARAPRGTPRRAGRAARRRPPGRGGRRRARQAFVPVHPHSR